MKIEPLVNQLGAIASDIDIAIPLTKTEQTQIREALVEHHLLLFRGKTLSPKQQIAFSKNFGNLEHFPWHPTQLKHHPEIFRLANNPRDGYENVGMYWHSDGTFRQDPTAISIFHLLEVPKEGGDTWFSNLHKTWESLPNTFQQKIRSLKTWHRNHVIHPLVNTHPVSGKEHIYLNVGLTTAIAGLTQNDAEEIISTIDEAFSNPENHYKHKWLQGDLIVADNFGVAHQASPVKNNTKRILHRTTVSADGVWWRNNRQNL
jgi:taurine dioxygenase